MAANLTAALILGIAIGVTASSFGVSAEKNDLPASTYEARHGLLPWAFAQYKRARLKVIAFAIRLLGKEALGLLTQRYLLLFQRGDESHLNIFVK